VGDVRRVDYQGADDHCPGVHGLQVRL
jgi:hypothetical protein